MTVNVFQEAARRSFRFPTIRGEISAEQLYQMPLTAKSGFDLDNVAKNINAKIKVVASEESFVNKAKTADAEQVELTQKLELVKAVIADKVQEAQLRTDQVARQQERQKLLGLLEKKKDSELEGLTIEEIEKRLAAL